MATSQITHQCSPKKVYTGDQDIKFRGSNHSIAFDEVGNGYASRTKYRALLRLERFFKVNAVNLWSKRFTLGTEDPPYYVHVCRVEIRGSFSIFLDKHHSFFAFGRRPRLKLSDKVRVIAAENHLLCIDHDGELSCAMIPQAVWKWVVFLFPGPTFVNVGSR